PSDDRTDRQRQLDAQRQARVATPVQLAKLSRRVRRRDDLVERSEFCLVHQEPTFARITSASARPLARAPPTRQPFSSPRAAASSQKRSHFTRSSLIRSIA